MGVCASTGATAGSTPGQPEPTVHRRPGGRAEAEDDDSGSESVSALAEHRRLRSTDVAADQLAAYARMAPRSGTKTTIVLSSGSAAMQPTLDAVGAIDTAASHAGPVSNSAATATFARAGTVAAAPQDEDSSGHFDTGAATSTLVANGSRPGLRVASPGSGSRVASEAPASMSAAYTQAGTAVSMAAATSTMPAHTLAGGAGEL